VFFLYIFFPLESLFLLFLAATMIVVVMTTGVMSYSEGEEFGHFTVGV